VVADGGGKFCSRKCFFNSRPLTMKECEICGKSFPNIRKRNRERRFCSRKCMGLGRRGENGPGWKGGVTPGTQIIRSSTAYKEWRESVFARDNWTCQDCGKGNRVLHAHHIFAFSEFPEHQLEVWNGVTLCHPCHTKYHPAMATRLRNEASGQKC
jgi:5-methylcytosine-specific restriction endonuclease McrA